MHKSKTSLPLWPRLVLGLLLILLLFGGALVLFFNFQYMNAEAQGALPSLNGCRYVAVADGRFGEKYAPGSLLLLRPKPAYQPGDEIVAYGQGVKNPQILLHRRYLLLQLKSVDKLRVTGAPIGMPEQKPVSIPTEEILGSVTHIIPHLGAVYNLILSVPGFLLFAVLPLALAIAWGVGLLLVSARRRPAPKRGRFDPEERFPGRFDGSKATPAREAAIPPEDRFDLFTEEPFTPNPVSAGAEVEPIATPPASPFMNPLAKRGAARGNAPEPPRPPALSVPAIPTPEVLTSAMPIPEAATPAMPESSAEEEEAVAIYSGGDETAGLEPKYLHQELSGSLAELKASLRTSRRTARVVDIVVGDQTAGSDADRLRRINSFDPNKAIAEIKRKNALFEQNFLSGGSAKPRAEEEMPASPPIAPPMAEAEKPPYPSRAAEDFYQIQPARQRELQRPSAPIISVVEEKPSRPSRFHNQNGEDRLR